MLDGRKYEMFLEKQVISYMEGQKLCSHSEELLEWNLRY
jgi:hypothetical protein